MNTNEGHHPEHENDDGYILIDEISRSVGIDKKHIDYMLNNKSGYPFIGENIRWKRREDRWTGDVRIHPEDYGIFLERLEKVAREVRLKLALVKKVQSLEKRLFPEFKKEEYADSSHSSNMYFRPSRSFEKGLINKEDVDSFISDRSKSLLSLGAGGAHLEKLLHKLGVLKSQMTLSDIAPDDLPKDYQSVSFDFRQPWPLDESKNFDLIIFPESLGVSLRIKKSNKEEELEKMKKIFVPLALEAGKHLKPGGQIRATWPGWEIERTIEALAEDIRPLKIVELRDHFLVLEKESE